ncbi:MAG: right-handed parallel beta-helix repeat-containing protein, partial [Methanophagales archaeon]|nr:right-handed parallel beta-helix repeat-containing protein [Methanophagales archaeon]
MSNNNCSNNDYGIYLGYSKNNSISNNSCSNNKDGIELDHYSNNNSIWNNTFSNNRAYGIRISFFWGSNNNLVYLNNFIDNTDNVYYSYSRRTNIWNSTEKITYIHNGTTYKSY